MVAGDVEHLGVPGHGHALCLEVEGPLHSCGVCLAGVAAVAIILGDGKAGRGAFHDLVRSSSTKALMMVSMARPSAP